MSFWTLTVKSFFFSCSLSSTNKYQCVNIVKPLAVSATGVSDMRSMWIYGTLLIFYFMDIPQNNKKKTVNRNALHTIQFWVLCKSYWPIFSQIRWLHSMHRISTWNNKTLLLEDTDFQKNVNYFYLTSNIQAGKVHPVAQEMLLDQCQHL